jgi:hypothetical protein
MPPAEKPTKSGGEGEEPAEHLRKDAGRPEPQEDKGLIDKARDKLKDR